MERSRGDLTDIFRTAGSPPATGTIFTTDGWQLPPTVTLTTFPQPADGLLDPFSHLGEPLLQQDPEGATFFHSPDKTVPAAAPSTIVRNQCSPRVNGSAEVAVGEHIQSLRAPGIKRRKNQARQVVCIPAPAAASSKPTGEVVPSDLWAWRKYGQKPIKGSPYPRGYYRCSSSKGCSARKQVERSRTDPSMLVVTYTAEHNHPWPTQRNALAGSTRPVHASKSSSRFGQRTRPVVSMKEEDTEDVAAAGSSVPVVTNEEASGLDPLHGLDRVFRERCVGDRLQPSGFLADLAGTEHEPSPTSLAIPHKGFMDPFGVFGWGGGK